MSDYKSAISVYEFRTTKEDVSWSELVEGIKQFCKAWAFQIEESDTGYLHYQGKVSLIKPRRKPEIMNIWKASGYHFPEYFEPSSDPKNIYSLKFDTRVEGPWTDKDPEIYIPKQFRNIKLYPWQEHVKKFVWDKDHIDVIIDSEGWAGKSTVARLCCLEGKSIIIPSHNDAVKLTQCACNQLMGKNLRSPEHIFIDLPRAYDNDKMAGLLSAIETIKSGYVCDERNHYKDWWFDSPNIWVFTNNDIPLHLLTRRRWRLWSIVDGSLERRSLRSLEEPREPIL